MARWLALGLTLALLGGATFAVMAANTVPATNAGQGANEISGYTISNVTYGFDHTPETLDSVTFTISPIPASVYVWFGNGTGTHYYWLQDGNTHFHCGLTTIGAGLGQVTCNNLDEPIDAVDSLNVSAAQ